MADIEAMAPKNQHALRFLWWSDIIDENHAMTVHVFGATDSLCCSNYCLKKVAEDNSESYDPEVTNTLLRHFYVDDMLRVLKNEEIVIQVADDLM